MQKSFTQTKVCNVSDDKSQIADQKGAIILHAADLRAFSFLGKFGVL